MLEQELSSLDLPHRDVRVLWPVLLIGCLSMFCGEVLIGSSQAWFLSGWGLLMTFPLYLAHTLFFLWIALKLKKTTLPQLYFFGVIFALYESWVTKVLWAGYVGSLGPGMGTFLGIGVAEFPFLVLFWHPVISFILPILIFEIMTGKALVGHDLILRRSWRKTIAVAVFLFLISGFIVKGNGLSLLQSLISVLGSLVLIIFFYKRSKNSDLKIFEFNKPVFLGMSVFLFLLYSISFFRFLPERTPQSSIAFFSILVVYAFAFLLIYFSKKADPAFIGLSNEHYSIGFLSVCLWMIVIFVALASIVPNFVSTTSIITYFGFMVLGAIFFAVALYHIVLTMFQK